MKLTLRIYILVKLSEWVWVRMGNVELVTWVLGYDLEGKLVVKSSRILPSQQAFLVWNL
jgi:hypothetical protein